MAAQVPDRILLNSEDLDLYSNPLELYWINTGKKRPSFHVSPECKRGYIADWEIKDQELFLTAVSASFDKRFLIFGKKLAVYTLKTLFPRCRGRLVKAIWFSGKLRIPHGKMTMYEHQGYESRFEKEIIVTVEKGKVIKMVTLDFTQKTLIVNSA